MTKEWAIAKVTECLHICSKVTVWEGMIIPTRQVSLIKYNDTSGYGQEDGMEVGGQQAHSYGIGNYGNTYMGGDGYDQYPEQFDNGMGAFRAERRACRRKRVQGPLNSLEHFESR